MIVVGDANHTAVPRTRTVVPMIFVDLPVDHQKVRNVPHVALPRRHEIIVANDIALTVLQGIVIRCRPRFGCRG